MINPDLKYQIALGLIKGVGPIVAKNLVGYFGDVRKIFAAKAADLARVPGVGRVLIKSLREGDVMARAEEELKFIERYGIRPMFFTDSDYPVRLANCDDGPTMLYVKGDVELNAAKVLSVVGTRRPTERGKEQCEQMIAELSARHPDLLVVSGLAYGIDVCAHRQSLRSGVPTVGVVAHGLDRVYPSLHRDVAAQMVRSGGGMVTEFMSGTRPEAQNFVKRNRIIAGLADVLLVVESDVDGGSLITAKAAFEYSRDVVAIPGSPADEMSRGCNDLIKRDVARLVESAADIEAVAGWDIADATRASEPVQESLPLEMSDEERKIYTVLLAEREMQLGALSVRCEMPIGKINSTLLSLELMGVVKMLPGNACRIV